MVDCETSSQILAKLKTYFVVQTREKVSQLKGMLQNVKKTFLSINEYLSKVKKIVDRLASIGQRYCP